MRFELIIDERAEETVTATVHRRSALTDELEALVAQYIGAGRLMGYSRGEVRPLTFGDIDCIYVEAGHTYAALSDGQRCQLRMRLYEAEQLLPGCFVRINKSAVGSLRRIERFTSSVTGSVSVVFKGGYRDYVSRRCFPEIKRRLET